MNSFEYRQLIRAITRNSLKRRFPGLKKKEVDEVAGSIAIAVHARFYGANVDGVDSPIWAIGPGIDRGNRHHDVEKLNPPNVDAKTLLEGTTNE